MASRLNSLTYSDYLETYLWKNGLRYELAKCELYDIDGLVVISKWKYDIPKPTDLELAAIKPEELQEMHEDKALSALIDDVGFKLITDYLVDFVGEKPDTEEQRRQRLKKIIKKRNKV